MSRSEFMGKFFRFIVVQWAVVLFTGVASAAESVVDYTALELPKAGDHTLHVLSPSLLELALINSKQPDPARVDSWDFVDANYQFQAPAVSSFSVTADGQPISVASVGFRRRPLYAPLRQRDLRIDNRLILRLASPLTDGQVIEVLNPNGALWPATYQFVATNDTLRYSPAIHVNQEGYQTSLPKKARVGYYLGNLGEMSISAALGFRLVDARTGAQVFTGSLTATRETGYTYSPAPYQAVLEANFTSFNTPGTYRLVVPTLGASLPFTIHDGMGLDFTRAYALGLYHQRCGGANALPWTRHVHNNCHTAPAEIPVPEGSFPYTWTTIAGKSADYTNNSRHIAPQLRSEATQRYPIINRGTIDVSKGHHDAGDYSKYTINSAALVHHLVFAVDAFGATMDNLGIPESGDGIPDLLQEAKWEADFLAKMQDADGGFYFLVYPRDRAYENNVLPDQGDPQVVWPKNTAASAAAVAALAQTASSPTFKQRYPAESAAYLQKALLGWNFLTNAIARWGKDGAYQKLTHYGDIFMHDDELAWAACEMYLATTNAACHQRLLTWYDPADANTLHWGFLRLWEGYGRAARSYAFATRTGRLAAGQLDATYKGKCETQIRLGAQDQVTRATNNAYGVSFPLEDKFGRNAGWFFPSARAFDLTTAYQLDARAEYLDAVLGNLNYEAGCNPVNVSYITGTGWKRQREIVHQFAQNDRRILPPSGLPLGAIQSGFMWMSHYGSELGALCFPQDGVTTAPYPFYDRWADSYNLTTEFVVAEQGPAVASLSYLATLNNLKTQAWASGTAQIIAPVEGPMNLPITARLQVPAGLDLSEAKVVWEAREQEPAFGTNFTFTPRSLGTFWIEAEATWPDGRRLFAATNYFTTNGPPAVTVTASDPTAFENGSDLGTFTFSRSTSNSTLTVFFTLSGTASNGVHYSNPGTSVVFPSGVGSKTLSVVPINNNLSEGNKTVIVTVASNATYAVATPKTATVTIYDDEQNLLPFVEITSPSADTVYIPNTNTLLALQAAVSDDGKPTPPGALGITWNRVSGFGTVTFSPGNSSNTTARFSSPGIYVLRLTANDGQYQVNDEVTVVVDPDNAVSSGLQAYWKFSETGGTTAADSSGSGRTATVSGAAFAAGRVNNALDLDGVDDTATFNSPALTQLSIAAWIRVDAHGDSFTPRVLEMPAFNVRLKRDSANGHSLAFESERSSTPAEWRTDLGTLKDSIWQHVTVLYDASVSANVPQIYINGTNQNITMIGTGTGTLVANTGTGYIGNRSTLDRSFDGKIDEVRVYNRLLTPAEIALLNYSAITNISPNVNAGADQFVYNSQTTLRGYISDDGKPNPTPTVAWTKISGPGSVTFGNAAATNSTAAFSAEGTYTLRLTSSDGELTVSDEVNITILPPPLITSITRSNTTVAITWSSSAGRFYRVYSKTNLTEPSWTQFTGNLSATGSSTTWTTTNTTNSPRRFYRIMGL